MPAGSYLLGWSGYFIPQSKVPLENPPRFRTGPCTIAHKYMLWRTSLFHFWWSPPPSSTIIIIKNTYGLWRRYSTAHYQADGQIQSHRIGMRPQLSWGLLLKRRDSVDGVLFWRGGGHTMLCDVTFNEHRPCTRMKNMKEPFSNICFIFAQRHYHIGTSTDQTITTHPCFCCL